MVCSFERSNRALLSAVFAALLPTLASAQGNSEADSAAHLRYLSFSLTDAPPSAADVEASLTKSKTPEAIVREWFAQKKELNRVSRFFNDRFGTDDFGLNESTALQLYRLDHGALTLPDKTPCEASAAVSASAWWLESGETDRFCPEALSTEIEFGTSGQAGHHNCLWPNAQTDSRCGCGPDQMICFPGEHHPKLVIQLLEEVGARGRYIYENNLTLADMFAGDFAVSTRLLYHLYLFKGVISPYGRLPSATEQQKLAQLPLDSWVRVDFPSEGAERAPIATQANFMLHHNNFRSRVSVLSEKLLCQGISPALNTDGISSFVNSDLTAADLEHGNKAACSGCHYPMDNMGSTLLQWTTLGNFERNISSAGHAFGQAGSGAPFLMQSIVERGPGFKNCMAKSFFEELSGKAWTSLSASRRAEIESWVDEPLQQLFQKIATSPELLSSQP